MEEGYIKFKSEWVNEPINIDQSIIEEIIFWRAKLYEKAWVGMYVNGIGFGNISHLLDDARFLISGSATGGLKNTDKTHYAVVENYDITQNSLKCRGEVPASSESLSHAALYNKGVKRIIHIHSQKLWAKWKGKLPTTNSEIAYGTPQMATDLVRCQKGIDKDHGVIIMGGHQEGIIAYGSDFSQLFELLNSL